VAVAVVLRQTHPLPLVLVAQVVVDQEVVLVITQLLEQQIEVAVVVLVDTATQYIMVQMGVQV
jgi:hypothetical protein